MDTTLTLKMLILFPMQLNILHTEDTSLTYLNVFEIMACKTKSLCHATFHCECMFGITLSLLKS